MPAPVKYGKIYMKDATGSIVQIVPDAVARNSIYQGATASDSGVAGLVPPAISENRDKYLRGDGTWTELTLPSDYVGATSSKNGVHGLVPSASIADKDKYLKGDGTWAEAAGSSGKEVSQVYSEIVSDSQTETASAHLTKTGWIGAAQSGTFFLEIVLGYSTGSSASSYGTTNFPNSGHFTASEMQAEEGEDAPNLADTRKILKSNVKYTTSFTLDSASPSGSSSSTGGGGGTSSVYDDLNDDDDDDDDDDSGESSGSNPSITYSALKISTGTNSIFTLEDGTIEHGSFFAAGTGKVANADYSAWTSHDPDFIQFTLPTQGQTKTIKLNAFTRDEINYVSIPNPDKFIEISYVDGNTYKVDFYWTYEEDVTTSETTTVKNLKTTVECVDGTSIESTKSLAGMLQNIHGSISDRIHYDSLSDAIVQENALVLTKEDAGGAKTVEQINLKLNSIASYATSTSVLAGEKITGFIAGIDASNLAVGGVYYEIESTEGTYTGI